MRKPLVPIALLTVLTVAAAPAAVADDSIGQNMVPAPPVTKLAQLPADPFAGPPIRIRKRGLTRIAGPNHVTNAGQPITTEVKTLLRRVASLNEVDYYRVYRGYAGEVYLRTYGHRLKLVVLQSAPATGDYKAFTSRTVYVNGKRRQ